MTGQEAEELYMSPEEIRNASSILAEALLKSAYQATPEACLAVSLSGAQIVSEDRVAEVISLDIMASASAGIYDPLGQLRDWLVSMFNAVASMITSGVQAFVQSIVIPAISAVSDFLRNTVMPAISGVITSIGSAISSAIRDITSTVSGFIKDAVSSITGAINAVSSTITGAIGSISSALQSVASSLASAISGAISTITSALTSAVTSLGAAISSVASSIGSAVSSMASAIINAIGSAVSSLGNAISSVASSLASAISGAISAISNALAGVASTIAGVISGAISTLSSAISGIASSLTSAISSAVSAISSAVSSMASAIMNAISGAISTLASTLTSLVTSLGAAISSLASTVGNALTGIASTIVNAISGALGGISQGITSLWNNLVGALQNITSMVGAGFQVIGNALMGFVNGILQAGQWVVNAIQNVGTAIWNALPGWLKTGLEAIGNFFKDAYASLGKMFTNPVEWIQNSLVKPVTDTLAFIWDRLVEGLTWVGNALKNAWKVITEAMSSLLLAISSGMVGILQSMWKSMEGVGMAFKDFFKTAYDPIAKSTGETISTAVKPFFETTLKEMGIGTPESLKIDQVTANVITMYTTALTLALAPFWGQVPVRLASMAMYNAGRTLYGLNIPVRINLRPVGIGVDFQFNLGRALGASLSHFSAEMRRYVDTIGRGFAYGFAIWATQPIVKALNYTLRNAIPIELPTLDMMTETVRRALPHEKFKETLSMAKFYMAVYGYSDYVIDMFFKPPEEYRIEVKDRFGQSRAVPLSLMYTLPSPSDVATMMVRDIFYDIDNFLALYKARGMHPDIGMLYYFLHFRYPPPERLWQFTSRGVSGLLWATLTDAEKAAVQDEVSKMGAFMPVSPADLNFKADALMTAFKTYMKWHDYFRGSWIKGFASDNLIYIDTLADIPTKVDQRWMVKWGLYELLSDKNVTMKSPVKEFATKVIENTPSSLIQMDLTNFSRTILATGMHPDWVPITAAAEAMNALSEERTAIRTGFMGLFKEGFYDVNALDTMLSGFISASFNVSYFDASKMQWTTGWVNLPVMYLPPERKLLELKALTDRSLDILREVQRDISTAYQEFIIWDYNEYKSKLTQVIESINTFYSSDYKAITGTELPKDLRLQFVEEYYKPYVEALKVWREVFTIRRVRSWTQRWLGWVMYRIAYGTAKKEDVEKLVSYVSEKAKLTDYETAFIRDVMDIMYGIARQSTAAEYLPTPTTLATLSEYMTLPTDLVKSVLEERGLPDQWAQIWLTYISVKPVKSDAKTLLSTYVRGLRYNAVTGDRFNEFLKTLPSYGFTEREISMVVERVNIEEKINESREYIPTPSTLATLSEYVVVSKAAIDKVFAARRVPEEWAGIWRQYIDVRPIADDVRGLITSYRRALLYAVIPKDVETKVVEYAKLIGFTEREFDIFNLRVQLEELTVQARENMREYIPTPSTLATICETIPEARQFFQQVMQARRVPKEWQTIWAKYIDLKPLVDDMKKYLSRAEALYVHFMITSDSFNKFLTDVAEDLGYTSKEIEFLMKSTELERAYHAWQELIGTVERLVTLSEYSPKAAKYALGKLYSMIDSLPISPQEKQELKEIWEEYIRVRPVKSEVERYITDLINLYVAGQLSDIDFSKELESLKKWGISDDEITFYKAMAGARRARKLKIPVAYGE